MSPFTTALRIFVIGLLLAAVFFTIAYIRVRMTRDWVSTTGIVVDQRSGRVSGGTRSRYPTFQWQDSNGTWHHRTSSFGQSLGPKPGDHVRIKYDPHDPGRAIVDTFVQSGRIFYVVAALILAVTGFLAVAAATLVTTGAA